MKSVYFRSCGGLYYIGKVYKNYNINDILKLKSMVCKLIVIDKLSDNSIVVYKKEA